MKMIKNKYHLQKFFLVAVYDRTDFIGEWRLPNVMNFYVRKRSGFGDWWTNEEWSKIFQQVKRQLAIQASDRKWMMHFKLILGVQVKMALKATEIQQATQPIGLSLS